MTTPAGPGHGEISYGWAAPIADRYPPAPALVTPARRAAAALLDLLLMVITLGAGCHAGSCDLRPHHQPGPHKI